MTGKIQLLQEINFRYDIINLLIKKNSYKSYLEIGVRNPASCFDKIECELKHGVDPMVEEDHPVTFKVTSDDFFSNNQLKYDIIFIDGLHLDYQVEKDIINSLNALNDGGIIVLHDCNPPDVYHQREDYGDLSTPAHLGWTGTVWKAVVKVRSERDDIFTSVVDIDFGIGLIKKSNYSNNIENNNHYYSYQKFLSNKKYYLNLISKEEFIDIYIPNNLSLTWLAKFDDYSSMGILSQNIIQELSLDVSCHPIIGETVTKNKQILDNIKKPPNHDLGIMFSAPDMYESLSSYKTKVIYTGVDTTEGVPNFKKNINNADFILTPSNKSKQRMTDIGVVKPIFVFPHGINPEIFKYQTRTKTSKFKFLYVGECSDRKGIFHLFKAFLSLFKDNMQVELHIKSNKDMIFYNGEEVTKIKKENTNIIWHLSNEGHDAIISLYNECHAYVYPSRADSFGMTLIEAMACGLPIISTSEPGSTELIENRFYNISSDLVNVENHPWMLGKWGVPSINDLKFYMKSLYENYDTMANPDKLKENSDFVLNNYSWKKVVQNFETEILPKLTKKIKIITLLTSYNRPYHIKNIINSLKNIREESIINDVYIVENSNIDTKNEIVEIINSNIDDSFKLHVSEFNMGQRGALLQMLEEINIDDYDYIQFTDQDNELVEPLSTYCEITNENKDAFFVTGYMSKEHDILGSRTTRHGKLYEKKSLRAGHMFLSVSNFKTLLPIHLDSQYSQPHNSSWFAGLDWEMSHWNKNAPGRSRKDNFVLCLPGGVLHKGIDSTFNNWDVKNYEYEIEELKEMKL